MQFDAPSRDIVTLYHCKDYYNYMYGIMPLTTGDIKEYELVKYDNGVLIRYPSRKTPEKIPEFKKISLNINKYNNSSITPRGPVDNFRDIEEYLAKITLEKGSTNTFIDIKNKKKEGNSPEKKINQKESCKIINDFYINNEGDIELTDSNKKDGKSKQKNEINNNVNVTQSLGPLMEEDENYNSIFINQNKSISNSKKELWKFQKILLENQIFDMKSKKL